MSVHEGLVIVLVASTIVVGKLRMDAIIEAIENFNDQFRGGGPRPMHPLPVNDRRWLRRKTQVN